jgi:hypothetical protein
LLVIGGCDMDAGAVSVRLHGKVPQSAKPNGGVVTDILAAIKGTTVQLTAARDFQHIKG